MEIGCSMLAGASLVALGCTSAMAEVTDALGSPEAHHHPSNNFRHRSKFGGGRSDS